MRHQLWVIGLDLMLPSQQAAFTLPQLLRWSVADASAYVSPLNFNWLILRQLQCRYCQWLGHMVFGLSRGYIRNCRGRKFDNHSKSLWHCGIGRDISTFDLRILYIFWYCILLFVEIWCDMSDRVRTSSLNLWHESGIKSRSSWIPALAWTAV